MEGNFIRVYWSTPDLRRVMFVYHYSSRLKYEPLSLMAFCVYHPGTGEYHSYKFTESYNVDLNRELYSFVNSATSYSDFSVRARISRENFFKFLNTLGLDDRFDMNSLTDRLF